jgi:hypothetical protein
MCGALSDEKSGLHFSVFAGHRQRSLLNVLLQLANKNGIQNKKKSLQKTLFILCLYCWLLCSRLAVS